MLLRHALRCLHAARQRPVPRSLLALWSNLYGGKLYFQSGRSACGGRAGVCHCCAGYVTAVPDDPDGAYDFGVGAGFYLDAMEDPFAQHYKMETYITGELPALIEKEFPVDPNRAGIFGHSMGGHGALTLHLKNQKKFKSCSAFSPIVAPSKVPWGQKALGNYLGDDQGNWASYDATRLLRDHGASDAHILIDQGTADQFLEEQLKPEIFKAAAEETGQVLTLRMQDGYDHSYYFIATFIEDHLHWHAERLAG